MLTSIYLTFQTSQKILNSIKIALLVAVWILFTGILMSKDEKVLSHHQLAVPVRQNKSRSNRIVLRFALYARG